MNYQQTNTNGKTLEGVRNILTVKNSVKLGTSGPLEPGTEIRCLRPNSFGYYMPCVAFIAAVTPAGKFVVDLWADKSERVCVSRKAVLWPDTTYQENIALGKCGVHTFLSQGAAEDFLRALPDRYIGRAYKNAEGRWTVSYHRVGLKHTDNCGRTGTATCLSCKLDCACWCHKQDVRDGN